jgi:hypothetical protein
VTDGDISSKRKAYQARRTSQSEPASTSGAPDHQALPSRSDRKSGQVRRVRLAERFVVFLDDEGVSCALTMNSISARFRTCDFAIGRKLTGRRAKCPCSPYWRHAEP